MGVDCTVFVLAKYSSDTGFVEASFRLGRDYDLWAKFNALRAEKTWAQIQLPQGSHSTFSDGKRPKEYEDDEAGYLHADCYGSPLRSRKGARFALEARGDNAEILAFVARVYADRDVVLFWH